MAYIRRALTASGATQVQAAEYRGGREEILEHVGSAHTQVELGVLLARARELLVPAGQGVLGFDVEPVLPVVPLVRPPSAAGLFGAPPVAGGGPVGPGQVVATASQVLFDVQQSTLNGRRSSTPAHQRGGSARPSPTTCPGRHTRSE